MAVLGHRSEPVVQATIFGGPRDPFVLLRETVVTVRDVFGRPLWCELRRDVVPRAPVDLIELDHDVGQPDPREHAASHHG